MAYYGVPDKVSQQLECNFTYHKPLEDQPERYELLRSYAKGLAHAIVNMTPPSREQSLALTNLEQAIFWANAAIARNEKQEDNNETDVNNPQFNHDSRQE